METNNYLDARHQSVVKSNDLIQNSRFNLSLQQQKIILFLISRIRPSDGNFGLYEFDIQEFCQICGINISSGKHYTDLKAAIKAIADQSIWVKLPNGKETLVRWIEKPYIDSGNGLIQIKLDDDLMPYLLNLKKNFTKYELIWTLHFRSKYTIRLYELCKSFHYHDINPLEREFSLDELRQRLGAENYKTYQHLKERVLDNAITEINEFSDKVLSYRPLKKGKKVIGIVLSIGSKDSLESLRIQAAIDKEMGLPPGQMTLRDEMCANGDVHIQG